MKLVLASHSEHVTSGAERSLLEIATYLEKAGAQVSVALPAEGTLQPALESRGIATHVLDYGWAARSHGIDDIGRSMSSLEAIVDWVAAVDPDVVLTSTSVIPWFAYAANALGKPHVWRVSEDMSANIGIEYFPDLETSLDFIATHSDVVIAPSRHMRDVLVRLLGSVDIRVVYPPMGAEILEHSKREPPTGDFSIVSSAAIYDLKNQLELLQAAHALRRRRTDFRVTLLGGIGSAAYQQRLEDFVRDNEMSSFVTFAGVTTDPYPVIAAHDICVITSKAEASSRTIPEAMLLKTAVVASDIPTNREKSGDGAAVLYALGDPADLAEKLDGLMADRGSLWGTAQRVYEYAHEFYFDHDQLVELWSSLDDVASRNRPSPRTWIDRALLARAAKYAAVEEEHRRLTLERDRLVEECQRLEAQRKRLDDEAAVIRHELDAAVRDARTAQSVADASKAEVASLNAVLEGQRALVDAYAHSTSWRVTEPLRGAGRALRGIRRKRSA